MKKKKDLCYAVVLLCVFVAWTLLVRIVDVRAIGPFGSEVGFSTINAFVHELCGINMMLYTVTDWLGLVPVCFVLYFACIGLYQWIKRKNIFKVDYGILVLGGYFVVVAGVFLFFESFIVNYRPVLIDGVLEASYPSSTTMLVTTVVPASVIYCNKKTSNRVVRIILSVTLCAFTVFMVAARLFSGVHWFSDIIGGLFFSFGVFMLYRYVLSLK